MKNATRTELENLEHDVLSLIDLAMQRILDNGDTPHKRISAIVGLNESIKSTMSKFERITNMIPEDR
jgi:hypothetical protein